MRRITDFAIFENEIPLADKNRIARWNNQAICNAVFYTEALGEPAEAEELLQKAMSKNVFALKALIFGALKSNHPSYTLEQFKKEFQLDLLAKCYGKVITGIERYLPTTEQTKQQAETLESDGPKSASFLNDYAELAVYALKMRQEDVLNASPRSICAMLSGLVGVENLKDEYYGDEIPWL